MFLVATPVTNTFKEISMPDSNGSSLVVTQACGDFGVESFELEDISDLNDPSRKQYGISISTCSMCSCSTCSSVNP